MQVSAPIVTLEVPGHRRKQPERPHVSKSETWGTHEFSRGKLLRCYTPPAPRRAEGKCQTCSPASRVLLVMPRRQDILEWRRMGHPPKHMITSRVDFQFLLH